MKFQENLSYAEQAKIFQNDIKQLTDVDVNMEWDYYNHFWKLSTYSYKQHLEIKDTLSENGYVVRKNTFENLYLVILPTQSVIERIENR